MVSLEGRVAAITGAGRGIGRQHALMFAQHGARVVVNDVGGASDGSGTDAGAARAVADEIVAAGGEAIASCENVSDFRGARRIIEAAVDAFGDLDIVINNAGILRDRMLVSMSEDDFDAVVSVHLKGTFCVTRWAADYWRAQAKRGRRADRAVVNTSSGAGLHGNVGQTNYAAAKMGIAAMTIVGASELARYGARVNCVAPVARTRLTEQTPGLGDLITGSVFDPENISPVVAYLASSNCPFTGQVFSVYGGAIGLYQGWSIAQEVSSDQRWTLETAAAAMSTLPPSVAVNSQWEVVTRHGDGAPQAPVR
jgi:NAD(P)-dependent dehydrogenase (short-subunit alcohol dehydrogenase family)